MATDGGKSFNPAYEAFRKHSADLLAAIQDPEVLAWELFSESAVTSTIVEFANNMTHETGARTSKLLMAMDSRIKVDRRMLDVFLSVLARRPSMSDLCKRMKDAYGCASFRLPPGPPAKRPRTEIMKPQHPPTVQPSDFQRNDQTPVLQYASYLKSVYTREKLPIYDKWPQVKSKKYINLALIEKEDITRPEADQFMRATIHGNIDDIKKSKRATDIGQIAQLSDGSQPKCILVEGALGVGKSTFAWKLCHKWGKGKLLQQYQLVVLLRLRDKSVRAAMNISELFQYHNRQIQQAAVEEIQVTGGKGVLLLFEGYDELPEELRTESSVFLDVITGRELPEATVFITSRPWASEFLHRECKRRISQHIEVLGFTKEDIQSYLESTTANDPSLLADLKKYISCYPHIGSLMYIPLNSAIVVEVYRNSRKDETLVPKTMTELYSSLVRSLLLRHLFDHPVHGKKRRWRVCSFSDLPQDVYQQLCELGRMAYEGILHQQQVIFSDLPEDFETLGLMQCAPELYADEGATVSYNFLHLTVQEYLAAFHLSQQPVEKQIEYFREYKEHKRPMHSHKQQKYFHMVLRFLCGVRKFNGYLSKMQNTCVEMAGVYSASAIHKVTFNTLHWLFEAHDNDVIAKMLGSSEVELHERFNSVTPFDCFVLGFCVSHSNCTWKIELAGFLCRDEGVELLVRGAVEEETHCTGGISVINLRRNGITSEGVKHLLSFPKQLINNLETLDLGENKLDSESCAVLAHLISQMPHLKKLSLYFIGQGWAVPLITSLTIYNSLEELLLSATGIGVEDCRVLSELLSSSTSLKELYIGSNELPSEIIELLLSKFSHNTTLKKLGMKDLHFSVQNIISLTSVLRTNHTLVYLSLDHCDIDSDGACQLASALCTNYTMQVFKLQNIPIRGDEAAAIIAEMLLKNKSLKELELSSDSVSDEGVHKLIYSLAHNTTVQDLFLRSYEHGFNYSQVHSSVKFRRKILFFN